MRQVLQDVADDFVENLAAFACELARHRAGNTLEARDIQLALGKRITYSCQELPGLTLLISPPPAHAAEKQWSMRLVGVGDHLGELKLMNKTKPTEAHTNRVPDVKRSKLRNLGHGGR